MIEIPNFYFALDDRLVDLCDKHNRIYKDSSLSAEMFLPTKSNNDGVGWDVRCAEPNGILINPGYYKTINLGFSVFCPEGWHLKLIPCSNIFSDSHCHFLYEIIDQSNSEVIKCVIQYIPDAGKLLRSSLSLSFGDKIAKIIPTKNEDMKVTSLSKEELKFMHMRKNASKTNYFNLIKK